MKISDDDAAFILGKGGKTKAKIAKVSGAELELFERDLVLEIRGTDRQRRFATKYSKCVMAQRVGPVYLKDEDKEDCTILDIPQEAVGFVTGRMGNFLRSTEDEWDVIMFFLGVDGNNRNRGKESEQLAIFGSRRGRRGASLKMMSAAETKVPGYFTDKIKEDPEEDDNWRTETQLFKADELSYALGKQGATRRKLQEASGCIIQYVGSTCFFCGTNEERGKAKDYMKWLFMQLEGPVQVDYQSRSDCTPVGVPADCVGYVTGARRAAMSSIEAECGVLMFFVGSDMKNRGGGGSETLLIWGPDRGRRAAELKVMSCVETKAPGFFTKGLKEGTDDGSGFGTDTLLLKDEDISYALGKGGTTRIKLQTASSCILQYVGNWVFIAGVRKERRRCREFLTWLLQQRRGTVTVSDVAGRDDCTEMHIPRECVGWVTGNRGTELRRIEQETGTFLFMALDKNGDERLLILGAESGGRHAESGRGQAERLVNELVQERLSGRGGGRRGDSRGRGGYGGGRGNSRRRSPSRRRRDSRDDSRRRRR